MPDRGKASIVCGLLAALVLTACTSTPGAKTEVKIPTFSVAPTSVVPPTTFEETTTEEPVAPIVEPPPPPTTKKPVPPKTTTPKPPPPTSSSTPPPPTSGPFVRLGAPCTPEGAIGITRDGMLTVCRKGGFPDGKRPRWRKA